MARGKTYGPHRYQYELGKRNYSFTAQVDAMIATTEKRLTALFRESVQRTVDIAQTPVAKGGKMRVDTGFLRASGQGSFDGMPTGPSQRPSDDAIYGQTDQAVELVIGKLTLGRTFFFGWTANYAIYREAYDGFLEAAAQRWPQTVEAVTSDIRKRITK